MQVLSKSPCEIKLRLRNELQHRRVECVCVWVCLSVHLCSRAHYRVSFHSIAFSFFNFNSQILKSLFVSHSLSLDSLIETEKKNSRQKEIWNSLRSENCVWADSRQTVLIIKGSTVLNKCCMLLLCAILLSTVVVWMVIHLQYLLESNQMCKDWRRFPTFKIPFRSCTHHTLALVYVSIVRVSDFNIYYHIQLDAVTVRLFMRVCVWVLNKVIPSIVCAMHIDECNEI